MMGKDVTQSMMAAIQPTVSRPGDVRGVRHHPRLSLLRGGA